MTDSYSCFSTCHVALADGLPYRQLFVYIQVTPIEEKRKIEETCEKEHMFRNTSSIVSY